MARIPKARTPKPNRFAHRIPTPCERCDYDWGRVAFIADPEATEYETFVVCQRCHHRIGTPACHPAPNLA